MNRFVSLTDQSTATSKFPGEPPPHSPDNRNRDKSNCKAVASTPVFAVGRATQVIRAAALALLFGVALPVAAADIQAPAVPTGLKGTMASSQIKLTWNASTDNVGVKGYQVFLNDVMVATTTAPSFVHTGAVAGATYNYRVNAFDAAFNYSGWTPTPASVKSTSDTTPPSVPTSLKATAASSTQINLTWNASTDNVGVKGYHVYLGNVEIAVTTKLSFQHIGRTPGTTYNYRVSAYDAVPNHSAWTATPVSVKTTGTAPPDTTPPSVPAGLAGRAISNTQINLTWTAATDNAGVKGYQVFLNDKVISTTTATSFQHTGLAAGSTYNYRVNAFDAANNFSPWTPIPVAVKTTLVAPLDTTAPSVPTGLKGTMASSQINLTWKASTDNVGVKGYQVFLNDVMVATTTAPSFVHTGAVAGAAYNYRVNAFDAANNFSGWTETAVAVTTKETNPGAGRQWNCTFPNSPVDCGFQEQAKVAGRASLTSYAREGGTALRLTTQPGDNNVSGSSNMERNDVWLTQQATDCYEGREQWWAHSILFPDDFAMPQWHMYVVADFHNIANTSPESGQANFHINFEPQADLTKPGVLVFRGYGGTPNGTPYKATIGTVAKNVWYDFVYHVKWSSGSDGYFDAWVNGVKKLSHRGPTLYAGQGCYLKLANYHVPIADTGLLGPASSVIHDRVMRGATALSVSPGPLEGVLTTVNGVLTASPN